MRTALLVSAVLAACTPSSPIEPATGVATATATVEAPPPSASTAPPADTCSGRHLYEMVQAVQEKAHKLRGDEAEAALAAFGDALIADPCVSDGELQAEKDRFDKLNASLHAGPVRVYPSPDTVRAIFGVPREIGRALEARKARRQKP
jgi:hypothetical protein